MKHAPNGRDVASGGRGSDPLQHLVKRIGVSEDVVRRLPVGVLVGVAEARDPKRRAAGERPPEVCRSGAPTASTIASGSSPSRSRARAAWPDQPCSPRAPAKCPASWPAAWSQSATRSSGYRHSVDSSAPRAATIWPTTVGSTDEACSQPIRSRHSNASLMKSSERPPSAKARSVSDAEKGVCQSGRRKTGGD